MSFGHRLGLYCMTVLRLGGPVERERVDSVCLLATALLARTPCDLICDVQAIERPTAATVDALARVRLLARYGGRQMCLRGANDRLCDLIGFVGLADVLSVETRREPE